MLKTLTAILALTAGASAAAEFTFVAVGDMPYGKPEEVYGTYESLIATVNAKAPALVVHVGDTKSGSTPCSNEMLADQLGYLESFAAPVLYTLGDNEWTDCHRSVAGGFDPLDRLAQIRTTYFADPSQSFGQTKIAVESQAAAGFPENTRVMHDGVMFVAAHIVGSNNNFEIRDPKAIEEFFARQAAVKSWVAESFEAAGDAAAVVLAIHADMFEFDWNEFGDETWLRHSGFAEVGPAIQDAAAAFGKPVLLIYGDSHVFRQQRPFPKKAANVMSVEVFGANDMHAVEIAVDTNAPGVFSVAPLYNPALAN